MIRRLLRLPGRPEQKIVRLRDGRPTVLKPISADDGWRLKRGLDFMSERSIYFRFFRPLNGFSPAELRYLTSVDHWDHCATGALALEEADHPGYGVARFVRDRQRPDQAEVALVVLDPYQGLGLGRTLLSHLGTVARRRGIGRFVGDILRENEVAAGLFRALGAAVWPVDDLTLKFALPVRNLR